MFFKKYNQRIKKPGNSINCIKKQVFTPICVEDIADVINKVIKLNIKTLHVGGQDTFDRKDIIKLVAKKLNNKKEISILKTKNRK